MEKNKGLLEKLKDNCPAICITAGLALGSYMAYQYVIVNQCTNTPLTIAEKFVGIGLIAYGMVNYMRRF
jgi:hypothetical protein